MYVCTDGKVAVVGLSYVGRTFLECLRGVGGTLITRRGAATGNRVMTTGHEKNEEEKGQERVSSDWLWCVLPRVLTRDAAPHVTANGEKRSLTVATTLFIIQREAYFPHLFTSRVSLS
ncbi:unnamed protein product [Lasius platythorax]|uniref:Uncharacterized protein n=1 Tax=Lasius platythorax TaxID=488582 RepID=A0AAV2NTI2_9HYME